MVTSLQQRITDRGGVMPVDPHAEHDYEEKEEKEKKEKEEKEEKRPGYRYNRPITVEGLPLHILDDEDDLNPHDPDGLLYKAVIKGKYTGFVDNTLYVVFGRDYFPSKREQLVINARVKKIYRQHIRILYTRVYEYSREKPQYGYVFYSHDPYTDRNLTFFDRLCNLIREHLQQTVQGLPKSHYSKSLRKLII
jgi:hypothetical protein